MAAESTLSSAVSSVSRRLPFIHKAQIDISSGSAFDLDQYISAYHGHAKIKRLVFIASRCPALATRAIQLAVAESRLGIDIDVYQEVVTAAIELGVTEFHVDQSWCDSVRRRVYDRKLQLENNLAQQKSNMIRESIRMAYNDLGEQLLQQGEFQAALSKFVESNDHCSSPAQSLEKSLNVVRTSVAMNTMQHVKTECGRALANEEAMRQPLMRAQFQAAQGLHALNNGQFRQAFRHFAEVHFDTVAKQPTALHQFLSSRDVGLYGGLCALATCGRAELKSTVLDDMNFRSFADLVPTLTQLIDDFYSSRYTRCMAALNQIKATLQLDLHIGQHVEDIYKRIRAKALSQYFSPFLSADMQKMSVAFGVSVPDLEVELAELISANKIQARIDSHNKILVTRETDQRAATYDQAISVGTQYVRDTKSMLLRMALVKQGLVVKPDPRRGNGPQDDGMYGSDEDFAGEDPSESSGIMGSMRRAFKGRMR